MNNIEKRRRLECAVLVCELQERLLAAASSVRRRQTEEETPMKQRPPYMENPDKYEIATEVLSSAIRVLLAAGFYESEILRLFGQVARKKERAPVWLTPLEDEPIGEP
jgi:hypothetical protein